MCVPVCVHVYFPLRILLLPGLQGADGPAHVFISLASEEYEQ